MRSDKMDAKFSRCSGYTHNIFLSKTRPRLLLRLGPKAILRRHLESLSLGRTLRFVNLYLVPT